VQGGLPKTVKAGLNELGFNVGDPRNLYKKASLAEINQIIGFIKQATQI